MTLSWPGPEFHECSKNFSSLGPDDVSDGAAGAIALNASRTLLCATLFVIALGLEARLVCVAVRLHRFVNGRIPASAVEFSPSLLDEWQAI